MHEHGEQDAFHGGLVLEGAHRAGAAADFAEASLNGIGGPHRLAFSDRRVAKAGQEVVEIGAQARHGLGVDRFPAVGEAAGGRPGGRQGCGVHDPMQAGLDGHLVGLADLVQNVADLVRPTALHGNVGEGCWQGGEQAGAAVDAQHFQALARKAAAHQVAQELLPLRGALGAGQAEVDDFLFAVRPQAQRHQDRPRQRAGAGLAP